MKIELLESLENIVANLLFIISSSILSYIMEDIFTEALTIISGRYWSNVTMKCLFLVMIHVIGNSFRSYMRGFNCGLPRWCDCLKISSITDAPMSAGSQPAASFVSYILQSHHSDWWWWWDFPVIPDLSHWFYVHIMRAMEE